MSEPKKKKSLAFPLGLILGILSIVALVIATVANLIPAESSRANGSFGTVVAISDFLKGFTFSQDALKGAVVSAIVAIALFVLLLILTLVAIKRNPKKVASGIAVTILSVYDCYLLSFGLNALIARNISKVEGAVILVVAIVALVASLTLGLDLLVGIIRGVKKEAALAADAPVAEETPVEEVAEEKVEETEEKPVEEEKTEAPVEEQAEEPVEEKAEEEVPAEEPVKEEPVEEAVEEEKAEEPAAEEKAEEPAPAPEEKVEEPVEEEPVPEETKEEAPVVEETPAQELVAKEAKALGKYEVFPEAGFFKYRLKANNGQILLVSNSYKTLNGAIKGIETFRKNVEVGTHKVVTDKKGRGQWRIFTANEGRLVVAGEIYPDAVRAQSALDSVLRFYATDKVVRLEEIPPEEIREWKANLAEVKPSANGKIEIVLDENKKFIGRLRASNGQLLFETSPYSTKAGLLSGIASIKDRAEAGNVNVTCDKQGSYQFKVFADNGMVLVMGQTYPSLDNAVSAANSTRNFLAGGTKTIDLTKAEPVKE
ncbi:MAG: DUF1508 domain-containing protein [Candidatus Enteromonas sp.]